MKDKEIIQKCINIGKEPDDMYVRHEYILEIWKQAQTVILINSLKLLEHEGLSDREKINRLTSSIAEQLKGDKKDLK